MAKDNIPIVSIVGRPNVGKSSLFNRIIGKRQAVVEEEEGTTRDRIEKLIKIRDKDLILVDTGGFLLASGDDIQQLVKIQIKKTITASNALLFVCDGENGLTPLDIELAHLFRRSGKKIILVINKIDNEKRKDIFFDFYQLGLGDPLGISCLHNLGIKELMGKVTDILPEQSCARPQNQQPIKIAVVGRPNVGKSSFLNKVVGEERVIVHEEPGTTRDSVDIYFRKDGLLFLLIDTAGIRHKSKVKKAVDTHSIIRSEAAIDRCDVALLIVDGMEGVTSDDIKVLEYIKEKGRGCVIIVNKWDLVKEIEMSRYEQAILKRVPEAKNYPIEFISAKTGRNALKAFDHVNSIKTSLDLFIDPGTLRDFLKEINPENVRISRRRRRPKFYNMAQTSAFPKEFSVSTDDVRSVTDFHTAFIENRLREKFPFKGVPIKIKYQKRLRKKSRVQTTS